MIIIIFVYRDPKASQARSLIKSIRLVNSSIHLSKSVLLWDSRPLVNAIKKRKRHTTAQMDLDVAVKQERPGVDNVVSDR